MRSAAHLEKSMEDGIFEFLSTRGWLPSPTDTGFDAERALFPEDLLGWFGDTQPEMLARVLGDPLSPGYAARLDTLLDDAVKRLSMSVEQGGGTLNFLKNPFRHGAGKFTVCVAKPAEDKNPDLVAKYAAVRLRIMRQVHYSTSRPNRSLDLVLFCNGLPVATIELKTDFTQSVQHGELQYAHSRKPTDPGRDKVEPLLTWGRGALVHFVVTNSVVSMTTKLAGEKTTFLPFNKGFQEGPGNPPSADNDATAYFWQDILERDMFIKVLMRYMLVVTEDKIDPATAKVSKSTSIRFPRFHQLDAVEKIIGDVSASGPGGKYLVEHSAGSGKTSTIVWTAQRLAALHDAAGKKMFSSVIVVTDRNVLDGQMTRALRQLDMISSQIATISDADGDSKSAKFVAALKKRTPIIVVTIQTAPFALGLLQDEAAKFGGNFAVIADEAHSSQSGNAAAKLREVLTPEEAEDLDEGLEIGADDILAAIMTQRAEASNISFLAFTATPKSKTIELFGRRPTPETPPTPFHRYSMRQAIQEGFILDVLQNYTPYDVAVRLIKDGRDSGEVDEKTAKKQVGRWVTLHTHNITQKVAIIVEHFRSHVAGRLDGNAKAMVVCSSRKEAVRFHKLLSQYITDNGYADLAALVAFSGSVVDEEILGDDVPVTESSMNPGTRGKALDAAFNGPDYQVMIVANKYQVGFDQPLLCAMYVNKKLGGVMAVQTLSRLNRTYPGKSAEDIFVLDFVNNSDQIIEAFDPYYRGSTLSEETDLNQVHMLAMKLDAAHLYDPGVFDQVAEASRANSNSKMFGVINPIAHEWHTRHHHALTDGDETGREVLEAFRTDLGKYVRTYRFLSQIVDYKDPELEKRAILYAALDRILAAPPAAISVDLSGLKLTHYRVKDEGSQKLDLEAGQATPLTPLVGAGASGLSDPKYSLWDDILKAINEFFSGTDLTDEDAIQYLDATLRAAKRDSEQVELAKANTDADFYGSTDVQDSFLNAVLDTDSRHQQFSTALLSNRDRNALARLLAGIKYRAYLADESDEGSAT
ncbi:type I restriction endonuclease subunit R [Arthrobacter sp. AFG20]|uniref:type I restriction endonuclease subunit R n=1 Tax=Arthrobacter sp. AFG20 TaxID=1688671 RepID=UPI000C9DCCBB|nr:DEAD/DEAH box helicase family protein [Arthrobacter sp. AFG20]PNH79226.1 restriction endonuclease subunit R [Arthrobacter sp. AFG20]